MKPLLVLVLAAAGAAFTGCASSKRTTPPVGSIEVQPGLPATHMTNAGLLPAAVAVAEYSPRAVHNGMRIEKVYLEPYVDENGNAYGPQERWSKDDHGWNLDAISTPSKAYIPAEMTAMAPSRYQPTSYMTPAANPPTGPSTAPTIRDVFNLEDVVVTGFVERSQEPLARATAKQMGDVWVPMWDDDLGWILLKDPTLQPSSS